MRNSGSDYLRNMRKRLRVANTKPCSHTWQLCSIPELAALNCPVIECICDPLCIFPLEVAPLPNIGDQHEAFQSTTVRNSTNCNETKRQLRPHVRSQLHLTAAFHHHGKFFLTQSDVRFTRWSNYTVRVSHGFSGSNFKYNLHVFLSDFRF